MKRETTGGTRPFSTCDVCGKRGFHTKSDAVWVRRQTDRSRHLSVYRCGGDGAWHVGGLPDAVIHGLVGRDVLLGDVLIADLLARPARRWPDPAADWTKYDERGQRRPPAVTLRMVQQLAGIAS